LPSHRPHRVDSDQSADPTCAELNARTSASAIYSSRPKPRGQSRTIEPRSIRAKGEIVDAPYAFSNFLPERLKYPRPVKETLDASLSFGAILKPLDTFSFADDDVPFTVFHRERKCRVPRAMLTLNRRRGNPYRFSPFSARLFSFSESATDANARSRVKTRARIEHSR